MAAEDLPTLRDELPRVFEDREPPAWWEDHFVIPVETGEKTDFDIGGLSNNLLGSADESGSIALTLKSRFSLQVGLWRCVQHPFEMRYEQIPPIGSPARTYWKKGRGGSGCWRGGKCGEAAT